MFTCFCHLLPHSLRSPLLLFFLCKKGGKEAILEEDLDFQGIEEEEDEESLVDTERNSTVADKDKGEEQYSQRKNGFPESAEHFQLLPNICPILIKIIAW